MSGLTALGRLLDVQYVRMVYWGYYIHFVYLFDSLLQCKGVDAVDAFFHQVFNPPTKLGIIGAGCSPSTQEAALVSQFYNITQVFYSLWW